MDEPSVTTEFKLLFDAASATLLQFGKHELRGQVGFTLVLHTWDQQLRPHYHLHCLIAAGALSNDASRWIAGGNQFLFSVRASSRMFRGKFLEGLRRLTDNKQLKIPYQFKHDKFAAERLLRGLWNKSWVIYSKAPYAGPKKLLDYLSRYTHRVAISNDRIVSLESGQVTFSFRDRSDEDGDCGSN